MRTFITILFCMAIFQTMAQQSPFVKFGKITADHLRTKRYSIDSNASAVVMSDRGHVKIKGNKNSWFSLHFVRHMVVHILSKEGYDMADIEIPLYTDGEKTEKLENIKALTYNLENEKVTESKLNKSGIYTEKMDKKWVLKKFTMPNVKEGSIIEIEYEVSSEFLRHIDPWSFQGRHPRLWSEFVLSAPSFFTYTFLRHGYQPMFLEDKKDKVENFTVNVERQLGYVTNTETINFTAGVRDFRWAMKDVPGLRPESFTSAIENHTARIEFQLATQAEPLEPHSYIENWKDLTRELDASDHFGKAYKEWVDWLPEDYSHMLATCKTLYEKAERTYEYVRDGYGCTGYRGYYIEDRLKNVVKTKKGTAAEMNLMLAGLLRSAGFAAFPLILSTSDNGYAYQEYASLAQFNYVIVQVEVEGKKYYLDASHPLLGFGKLLPECYNGHARLINEEATVVYLMPESITEKKVVTVFLSNAKDGQIAGSMKQFPGYHESYKMRETIRETGEAEFLKQEVKGFDRDVKVTRSRIDSLKNYNSSLGLQYEFELTTGQPDILYFHPLFGEGYKKNPFESAVRYYPVEMPYLIDETFVLTMEVPEGYVVDELPKQLVARVDEKGSGQFEYRIAQSGQTISIRMVLRFKKAVFSPEEYDLLRGFFRLVVEKQSEPIVFKKKML